jgi:hypothetical protein
VSNLSKWYRSLPFDWNRRVPFRTGGWEAGVVFLLALAAALINYKMIRDGLNGMSDLRWHVTWVQHFSKQIAEGIWYPRWLAGTNFGYGSPTFVFYPPLVYYIGSALKLIMGLNIQQTMAALFSLALFGAGLSFYICGRNRWGKIPALVGALTYMTAPYIAHNIYYRGALAETWTLVWVPLGLWLTEKAIERPRWRVALAILFSLLALTNVPGLLICLTFWLPYTLLFLLNRSWKTVATTIAAAGVGLGVASFYLLPAILEKHLVSVEGMREVSGGFRANLFGTQLTVNPTMANRIVPIFMAQSLAIIFFTAVILFLARRQKIILRETWGWIAFLLALSFLMSIFAAPIWQITRTLQMVQFPWRLLGLLSFGGAALCAIAVRGAIKTSLPVRTMVLMAICGILLWNINDSYKLSRSLPAINNPGQGIVANWEHIKTAIYDPYTDKLIDVPEYRPILSDGRPVPEPAIGQPPISVVSGKASVTVNQWGSYTRNINVIADSESTLRIRTYYYPAWHLYVNDKPHPVSVAEDGTITFGLASGSHAVKLRYLPTGAFTLGVAVSVLSMIALVVFWLKTPVPVLK